MPALALVVATAVSQVGSELTVVALPWFVLQTTGSAAQTGLTGSALALPQFLSGIVGGAVIDRLGYRRVSIAADLVSGAGIAAIPLLYATGTLAFWQLLGFVFVGGLLAIPGLTARRSMLPEVAQIASWRLERMNAIFEGISYMALLIGPAVAGLLVAFLGAANVLWLDAATFVFSAALVRLALPRFTARLPEISTTIAGQLGAGLRFLAHDKLLLVLAIQLAISNFLTGPLFSVALPVYARDEYGSATALGLLLASLGLGMLFGTFAYGLIGHRVSRRLLWLAGYLAVPLDFLALVLGFPLPVVLGIFVVTGFVSGPLNPLLVTVRHERIPPEMRGRVFSTFSAIAQIAQPVGIAAGGSAIELFGFRPTIATLGIASLVLALAMTRLPVLRQMEPATS